MFGSALTKFSVFQVWFYIWRIVSYNSLLIKTRYYVATLMHCCWRGQPLRSGVSDASDGDTDQPTGLLHPSTQFNSPLWFRFHGCAFAAAEGSLIGLSRFVLLQVSCHRLGSRQFSTIQFCPSMSLKRRKGRSFAVGAACATPPPHHVVPSLLRTAPQNPYVQCLNLDWSIDSLSVFTKHRQ